MSNNPSIRRAGSIGVGSGGAPNAAVWQVKGLRYGKDGRVRSDGISYGRAERAQADDMSGATGVFARGSGASAPCMGTQTRRMSRTARARADREAASRNGEHSASLQTARRCAGGWNGSGGTSHQFGIVLCQPVNIRENVRHGLAVKARPHSIWAASERIAMAATTRMAFPPCPVEKRRFKKQDSHA